MPPKTSRRLVIDASIAHAAGASSDVTAKSCREFLACVLSVSHRIVMTSGIDAEWKKHRSRYFSTWLVKMQNLRKIDRLEPGENSELRERIQEVVTSMGVVQAMLKDIHLIEAALAADQIVLSLDEKVRGHFSTASSAMAELEQIIWANPVVKKEKVVDWLKKGANAEKSRRLGYRRR